jgi:hypothetical protein
MEKLSGGLRRRENIAFFRPKNVFILWNVELFQIHAIKNLNLNLDPDPNLDLPKTGSGLKLDGVAASAAGSKESDKHQKLDQSE